MVYSPDYLSYAYSGLVVVGGVAGYVLKGSMMSLGGGLLFGTLLAYGAYRTSVDPKDFLFLLVVTSLLAGVMGFRYIKTSKMMPAGMVTLISIAQAVRLAARFF